MVNIIKKILMEDKVTQKIITADRVRTNLFKKSEQKALVFLVKIIPSWISSDMLTFIGFLGSLLIFLSFILAAYLQRSFLLLAIPGFIINWFGDSLDGRLAFYRNKIRKWYGFSLDLTTDWINTIIIGWGYMIYAQGPIEMMGFAFVVLYGWAIIITLIRYKVTGEYMIDSGKFGPTEVRILISLVLVAEVIIKDSIIYSSILACIALLYLNIHQTVKLLFTADFRDISEREKRIDGEK